MYNENLKHLANLLNTFIFEYGDELQESSTYTETDKVFVSDVEEKIAELIEENKLFLEEKLNK